MCLADVPRPACALKAIRKGPNGSSTIPPLFLLDRHWLRCVHGVLSTPPCPILPPPVFLQTDIDKSGEIEYGEFLAATLHLSKIDKQENLMKAFKYFDTDNSGTITLDELQKALEELKLSKEEIESMMKEIDADGVSGKGRGSKMGGGRRVVGRMFLSTEGVDEKGCVSLWESGTGGWGPHRGCYWYA